MYMEGFSIEDGKYVISMIKICCFFFNYYFYYYFLVLFSVLKYRVRKISKQFPRKLIWGSQSSESVYDFLIKLFKVIYALDMTVIR